ncbi:MAG TPA: molybdopterin-dependent oxidoreductase, partial [Actinomycetota bacterium]|nr:molybdopterin-dependent oxidoreductase [Actinomycetota bacterium]
MSERRMGVSAALLGAAAGLAGSGVLAIAVAASPFPPITIADTVVRATPGGVATRAIEVFGHRALPLTVVGTTGLFAAASAALGWLAEPFARERRRYAGAALASAVHLPLYAAVVVALFVGDGSTDPLRSISLLVPPLGLAVAVTMLGYRRPSGERPFSRSRRQVLAAIGLTAAGLAVGWIGSVGLPSLRGRAGVRQLDLDELPAIVPGAGPFDVPGLTPELTPTDEHYVVDASIVDPVIDEDAWALSIRGLVERPLTLSYEDLLRLPRVERTVTMECISNEIGGDLISTARWGGVRLRDLLLRAGVRDEAI